MQFTRSTRKRKLMENITIPFGLRPRKKSRESNMFEKSVAAYFYLIENHPKNKHAIMSAKNESKYHDGIFNKTTK